MEGIWSVRAGRREHVETAYVRKERAQCPYEGIRRHEVA
jgi:hypothetical protein